MVNYLFSTTEKWKESIDQSLIFGDFLIDLSKALDCFSHELMIAKTAWKVSVLWVSLVRIFLHSDWIWKDTSYSVRMQENMDQKIPNMDTFYAV